MGSGKNRIGDSQLTIECLRCYKPREIERPQFEAGLSLLPALPPQDAADVLETRVAFLKHDIEQLKQGLQAAKAQGLPALFAIESEYRLTQLEAEYTYVEHLIERIRQDGCGYLQKWQQWHAEKAPHKKSQ